MYHFFERYDLVDIYKLIDKNEMVTYSFRYDGHSYTCNTLSQTYDLIKELQKKNNTKQK